MFVREHTCTCVQELVGTWAWALPAGGTQACTQGWCKGDWGCTGCTCVWGCVHCTRRSVHKRVCTRGCAAGVWECLCTAAHTQDSVGTGRVRTEGTRSTQLPSERAAQAEKSKYLIKAPHSHETPGGCLLAGTACSRWSSQEASLNLVVQGPPQGTRVCVAASCRPPHASQRDFSVTSTGKWSLTAKA